MGGFYFEIIKDRQYTLQAKSKARRSSQTAIYHILQAFVRWIAPILSFTADEIWDYLPGEHGDNVFIDSWYQGLFPLDTQSPFNQEFWTYLADIRADVNKAIEQGRNQKAFAQSLEVNVEIYANEKAMAYLQGLKSELRFVFLCSSITLIPAQSWPEDALVSANKDYAIRVKKTSDKKCARCWHYVADVGSQAAHPDICGRCVDNLYAEGEQRLFV